MSLEKSRRAGNIDLAAVSTGDGDTDRRIGHVPAAEEVEHLGKEALESGRGNDLEDQPPGLGQIPECVLDGSRLEHERASPSFEFLVADLEAKAALDDKGILVLAGVGVRR